MKSIVLGLAICVMPFSAGAEERPIDKGLSLLEEGTALLLQGLLNEIEPRLSQLEDALGELNAYHPPEILPNGDIIIRRRKPEDEIAPVVPEGGEIDL